MDPIAEPRLILINGIAEQSHTWFRNLTTWRRQFPVFCPNLITYEGESLHVRVRDRLPIDVAYLTERLQKWLDRHLQSPPYVLVASSMGCKVAVQYAVRHPERVARLVLLGPSGMAEAENLPLVEGVRWAQPDTLVQSVFCDHRHAGGRLRQYYRRQFGNRRWRLGLLHTVRGTMGFSLRDLLVQVHQPTLVVLGREDRIVDPQASYEVARRLPAGEVVMLPRCGHAPQIEQARWVTSAVMRFATGHTPVRSELEFGALTFPTRQRV